MTTPASTMTRPDGSVPLIAQRIDGVVGVDAVEYARSLGQRVADALEQHSARPQRSARQRVACGEARGGKGLNGNGHLVLGGNGRAARQPFPYFIGHE